MEKSIASELYSEILNPSNVELNPSMIPNNAPTISKDDNWDDLWYDEALDDDMDREWQRRHTEFHTSGYREGLVAAKEASAQEGFNIGYQESVFVGQRWGLVRGVTSALACLPDGLKERLVETEEKRNKYRRLHESVRALSTNDALKLFHGGLKDKGENTQSNSGAEDFHSQSSEANILENYMREFNLLILESSVIKLHL